VGLPFWKEQQRTLTATSRLREKEGTKKHLDRE
jgi:hypothetical protein